MKRLFSLWNDLVRIAPHFLSWYLWKRKNRHNRTAPVNVFNQQLVTVGRGSYGGIEVYSYGSPDAHLTIGNYVSIGPRVRFMLSGEQRGVPARVLRYRFPQDVCDKCATIDWGSIAIDEMTKSREALTTPVTGKNVDLIIRDVVR